MTHTPGPWEVVVSSKTGYPVGIDAPNDMDTPGGVGHIIRQNGIGFPSSYTALCNANLIAAAPDLLEALTRAMLALEEAEAILGGEYGDHYAGLQGKMLWLNDAGRAAIAKARGEKK